MQSSQISANWGVQMNYGHPGMNPEAVTSRRERGVRIKQNGIESDLTV
ncbi:MAG: hypothetical protein KDK34_16185 [Leptospiraceae bacterium]|nr:hypothetical protein [Leptospiraceae bacterium]MCB1321797.1 hypothetical protein [Leptospiraceae bacterium]